MIRGVRARLVLTVIGLVAATSLVLGTAAYLYVATSLRSEQLRAAVELTNFNVSVLAVERLPDPTKEALLQSHLLDGFASRGIAGTIVDFGDGDPFASNLLAAGASERLSPAVRSIVASGDIGYERLDLGGQRYLVTGARRPNGGPDFYFLVDSGEVEGAIDRLGQALAAGAILLVALAAMTGGLVARRLLKPVAGASKAAEQIASGDLSARLAVASHDEFGAWAASFNRMAAALEEKVGQLQAAQARERRFVADVSHELRTPLTALVNEAALIREHVNALPPGARRAGELLVHDIGRLRTLVEDLIEISRFDASVEEIVRDDIDLTAFLRSVVAARALGARTIIPAGPERIVTDQRRLESIVGNLLDNARIHGEGREVEVEAVVRHDEDAPDELQLAVSDRGPGVDPAELPHLFERFRKADPSRHLGGSGLGLAIALEHTLLLGGSLSAALRPEGGLRFELRLPVTRPLPAGDTPVTVSGDSHGQPKNAGSHPDEPL